MCLPSLLLDAGRGQESSRAPVHLSVIGVDLGMHGLTSAAADDPEPPPRAGRALRHERSRPVSGRPAESVAREALVGAEHVAARLLVYAYSSSEGFVAALLSDRQRWTKFLNPLVGDKHVADGDWADTCIRARACIGR